MSQEPAGYNYDSEHFSLKLYPYDDIKDRGAKVMFTKEFKVQFIKYLCKHKKELIDSIVDYFLDGVKDRTGGYTIKQLLASENFIKNIGGATFGSYFESEGNFLIDLGASVFNTETKQYDKINTVTSVSLHYAIEMAKELCEEKYTFGTPEATKMLHDLASLDWTTHMEILEFKKPFLFKKGYIKIKFTKPELAEELDAEINKRLEGAKFRAVSHIIPSGGFDTNDDYGKTFYYFIEKSLILDNFSEFELKRNDENRKFALSLIGKKEFVIENPKSEEKETTYLYIRSAHQYFSIAREDD